MLVLVSEILAFLILLPISRYLCITPVQSVEPACKPNVQICSLLVPKKTKKNMVASKIFRLSPEMVAVSICYI